MRKAGTSASVYVNNLFFFFRNTGLLSKDIIIIIIIIHIIHIIELKLGKEKEFLYYNLYLKWPTIVRPITSKRKLRKSIIIKYIVHASNTSLFNILSPVAVAYEFNQISTFS